MKKNAKEQIIQVVTLLTSAVVCATLLASLMIYYYGPSGRYVVGNTILSPDVLNQINHHNQNTKTGSPTRFIFDSIQFSYFDKLNQQHQLPVDFTTYQKFYTLVETIKSLENTEEEIKEEFNRGLLASLTLSMHADKSVATPPTSKLFQVVEFIDKDYFRVQLHSENQTGEWAYFYQPHIYQDVIELFTKT